MKLFWITVLILTPLIALRLFASFLFGNGDWIVHAMSIISIFTVTVPIFLITFLALILSDVLNGPARESRRPILKGMTVFFLLFAATLPLGKAFNKLGASIQIDRLGGKAYASRLIKSAEALGTLKNESYVLEDKSEIPPVFRELGAEALAVDILGSHIRVRFSVSGAFFPSGWNIMVPPVPQSDSLGIEIYPGVYRWFN